MSGHIIRLNKQRSVLCNCNIPTAISELREFFRRHPRWDHVPDPYYEGAEGFELVLDMLEDGCGGILEYLENPQ